MEFFMSFGCEQLTALLYLTIISSLNAPVGGASCTRSNPFSMAKWSISLVNMAIRPKVSDLIGVALAPIKNLLKFTQDHEEFVLKMGESWWLLWFCLKNWFEFCIQVSLTFRSIKHAEIHGWKQSGWNQYSTWIRELFAVFFSICSLC